MKNLKSWLKYLTNKLNEGIKEHVGINGVGGYWVPCNVRNIIQVG